MHGLVEKIKFQGIAILHNSFSVCISLVTLPKMLVEMGPRHPLQQNVVAFIAIFIYSKMGKGLEEVVPSGRTT